MENQHFVPGESFVNRPFSIAMLHYRRVPHLNSSSNRYTGGIWEVLQFRGSENKTHKKHVGPADMINMIRPLWGTKFETYPVVAMDSWDLQ